ncbi:MAG TPA: hypothetical protein VN873_02845, partial [Candidatus Angelobacter sp.]|nr:hypothetical protein [Candidatus Angelobacter sp.]
VEGKISNKQFRTHVMSYCPKLTLALSRLFPTAGFQSSLNRVHLKISMPWNDKLSILDTRTMNVFPKIASVIAH